MASFRVVPSVLALAATAGVTRFGGWLLRCTYPLFEPFILWHHKKFFGPLHPDPPWLSLDFTFILACFVTGAFLGGMIANIISRQDGFLFALLVAIAAAVGAPADGFPRRWFDWLFLLRVSVSALIGFYFTRQLRRHSKVQQRNPLI